MTKSKSSGISNVEKEGDTMIKVEIEKLKKRLDSEIEAGCPYEQILKTSVEIDELLAKYYLEEIKDII